MSVITRIAESPSDWTASEVLDVVFREQYTEPDRRRDPSVPGWLRDLLTVGDLETHLQMEGLLGWWESRADEELDLVCDALVAVGLGSQADLFRRAAHVLTPVEIGAHVGDGNSVSSFEQRHPHVSEEQYRELADVEERLWYNDPSGPDVYDLLLAHATNGLARSSE